MQPESLVELIAGVDEAGRGPLAGPVIASAVILPESYQLPGLNDSKKLTEKNRERLFDLISEQALAIGIGRAEVHEIDAINILQASLLAMQRAVQNLTLEPQLILVDGSMCPKLPYPTRAIVGGDGIEAAISAASVIAKVTRDREMLQWHKQFPQYGFAQHKGYPTAKHVLALSQFGISPIHRRSFGPVKALGAMELSVELLAGD